jgi:hypothetical protein
MVNQDKVSFIQSFIDRVNVAIDANDVDGAKRLQSEIVSTFASDIPCITSELDSHAGYHSYNRLHGKEDPPVKYVEDLGILRNRLVKLQLDIKEPTKESSSAPLISLTQVQNQTTNVQVDFDVTVSAIEKIPESSLSQEDKEILLGKLTSIKGCSDKKTRWDKCKGILKWLADKSADAAIAVLPYLVGVLKDA